MDKLRGFQKKYLRGLAHSLNPVVLVGQKGLTESLIESMQEALDQHELIKVKFNEFKEKAQKQEMTGELEEMTGSQAVGMVGHVVIFYRQHEDAEKRKIVLPDREA